MWLVAPICQSTEYVHHHKSPLGRSTLKGHPFVSRCEFCPCRPPQPAPPATSWPATPLHSTPGHPLHVFLSRLFTRFTSLLTQRGAAHTEGHFSKNLADVIKKTHKRNISSNTLGLWASGYSVHLCFMPQKNH